MKKKGKNDDNENARKWKNAIVDKMTCQYNK